RRGTPLTKRRDNDVSPRLTSKTCYLLLLRLFRYIGNDDIQGGIFHRYLYCLHLDEMAKPLLQRALNKKLGCSGHFWLIGTENKLRNGSAEIRQVDPLAWYSEQYLLNELLNMPVCPRCGEQAFAGDTQWICDKHLFLLISIDRSM